MGIRFRCQHCRKVINVKRELERQTGVCPYCRGLVHIPDFELKMTDTARRIAQQTAADEQTDLAERNRNISVMIEKQTSEHSEPGAPPEFTRIGEVLSEAPNAIWYVRPPSGGQYGPASNELLRQWLVEGRVDRSCLVWRDDWKDWLPAHRVFSRSANRIPSPPRVKAPPRSPKTVMYMRDRQQRFQVSVMTLIVALILLVMLSILLVMLLFPVPSSI